jgi:hypothetical protein
MHGGAAGSGAPKGRANGRYRTGLYTQELLLAFVQLPPHTAAHCQSLSEPEQEIESEFLEW